MDNVIVCTRLELQQYSTWCDANGVPGNIDSIVGHRFCGNLRMDICSHGELTPRPYQYTEVRGHGFWYCIRWSFVVYSKIFTLLSVDCFANWQVTT